MSLIFLACVAVIVAGIYLFFPPNLPSLAEVANQDEVRARMEMAQALPGTIVFDSNRSGTFGVYALSLDGAEIVKIVDSELHDMYPDPSPDGKLIAFARSTSSNKGGQSAVWLVRPDGSELRKLADNGTFPTFSADGTKIYFERERNRVIAVNLDGSGEREIFPAGNADFPPYKYQVVKPRVSANERYVFFTTDKEGRWNAFYGDLQEKKAFHINRGCEPAPFQSNQKVAWVSKRHVLDRSGIGQLDLVTKEVTKLHDAGPPRGHEYFPSLADQDRFLLYSACREREHSHETSNYQIFVKDLGSGKVARLTFDPHTNRWPKLLRKAAGG